MISSLGAHNPLRYRGYIYDTETKLYYIQNRFYNPQIGRFISADENTLEVSSASMLNLFVYAGGNPVSMSYNVNVDGMGGKSFALPAAPAWTEYVTEALDYVSSLSESLIIISWSMTKQGRMFLNEIHLLSGADHYSILDNLKTPIYKPMKYLGIGLIAVDLLATIYNSVQQGHAFFQGMLNFSLTGAKDIAIYTLSAKVTGLVGTATSVWLGAKLGTSIGWVAGPLGAVAGLAAGVVVGLVIDAVANWFIDEVNKTF